MKKIFCARSSNGNILFMITAVLCFVVLPLFMVCSQVFFFFIERSRTQSVVEAASLIAANDVSRIIVNDPDFGFVALSNYPPVGVATCAADGEPLPVTGINTLVATVRQNTIVAKELENPTIDRLAENDHHSLQRTVDTLNSTLSRSLSGNGYSEYTDIHGRKVDPVRDVQAFLKKNLPANVHLKYVRLSNGWLRGGTDTATAAPQPARLAQVREDQLKGGEYQAFIDMPVSSRNFHFAGLGRSSSLVSPSEFCASDRKHINSIVRLDCLVSVDNVCKFPLPFGLDALSDVQCAACAQPFTLPDIGPKGVMTLRFTGGPVPGLQSWSDFLNAGNFRDTKVTNYDISGGDYPLDSQARMIQLAGGSNDSPGAAELFAENLFYWLRNGHARPRVDAVLAMVNEPFRGDPDEVYAYEFTPDGRISRRILTRDPFPVGVTADAQNSTVIDTSIQGGINPVIVFRNDVKRIGVASGGKHAGQPLPGYPLNWCELREYGGDEAMAQQLGKGRLGTKMQLVGQSVDPYEFLKNAGSNQGSAGSIVFCSSDGKALSLQPRKNFYSGGLALDIEIGGTRQIIAPAAEISRMRMFTAGRRI